MLQITSKYFNAPIFSMLPSGPRRFAGERGEKPSVQAFGGTVELTAIPGMSIHFTVYGRENDQAEVEFGCSMPGTSNRGRGKQIMSVPSDMRPEFKQWVEHHASTWSEFDRVADAAVHTLYQSAPIATPDQPIIPVVRLTRKRPDGATETVATAPITAIPPSTLALMPAVADAPATGANGGNGRRR